MNSKFLFLLCFIVSIPILLSAQNDSVPDVVTTSLKFERMVILRIKPGVDLLEGIQKAVEKERIKNAVILTGIGSVTQFSLHSVNSTTFPTKNVFITEKGPFDIVNVNGYVFNGRIHSHATFSDLKKTVGGHLEPGTRVYTFAIITIGIVGDDANMDKYDNWRWR